MPVRIMRREFLNFVSGVLLAFLYFLAPASAQENSTGQASSGTARAIVYLPGPDEGQGEFKAGTVTWAQVDAGKLPAIQATLDFSDLGGTVTVVFFKNSDPAVAASHLIGVQFFDGKALTPIPALASFLVKATAEDAGQSLFATAVPKTEGTLWIALPSEQSQAEKNVRLLLDGSWFEMIPIGEDGKRAHVIFEKGEGGNKVFRDVFQAWSAVPASPSRQVILLGCYKDPNNPFDLDGYLERNAKNTPGRCVKVCKDMGFAYAGVQYGESCVCGNRYGQFGPAANCDMPCTGDPSQICGGMNANIVYKTGL